MTIVKMKQTEVMHPKRKEHIRNAVFAVSADM